MFRGAVFLLAISCAPTAGAYSVLTHEAIIDTAWEQNITPLLLKRFPQATPDDLRNAHAYAYGGCIIQDMGYYPFGSKFFSDLTHYVRSGDFVVALINDANDLNEYAFALGALAHYAADNNGHPIAVNRAVPMEYPKLERKFGDVMTYEDDPAAHLKVEFGFDVLQVARGNYAPKAYHDFIGFKVSKSVLDRAFSDTYALSLHDIFKNLDLALGTYRRAVSSVIPEMTKVAWKQKKNELMKAQPGVTRRKFVYNLSKASYHKEWDRNYEKPGVGATVLAFLFRIIPKIGPFKAAALKPPTPETAKLFEESFNRTLDVYRGALAQTASGSVRLPDFNFDIGKPTRPAEYRMADDAYAKLVIKLADKNPAEINPALRRNILAYYSNLDLPYDTKKDPVAWEKTVAAVMKLRSLNAGP